MIHRISPAVCRFLPLQALQYFCTATGLNRQNIPDFSKAWQCVDSLSTHSDPFFKKGSLKLSVKSFQFENNKNAVNKFLNCADYGIPPPPCLWSHHCFSVTLAEKYRIQINIGKQKAFYIISNPEFLNTLIISVAACAIWYNSNRICSQKHKFDLFFIYFFHFCWQNINFVL